MPFAPPGDSPRRSSPAAHNAPSALATASFIIILTFYSHGAPRHRRYAPGGATHRISFTTALRAPLEARIGQKRLSLTENRYFTHILTVLRVILYQMALRATGAPRRAVLRTILALVGRFAPLRGPEMAMFGDFRPQNPLFYGYFDRLTGNTIPYGCLQHHRLTRTGARITLDQV